MIKSTTDSQLLARHNDRLSRRIQRLEAQEERYFWYRLGAFVGGAVLTWLAFLLAGRLFGWLALLTAAVVFGALVTRHARLRQRLACNRLWLAIYQQQAARQALDWAAIPEPAWKPEQPRGGLATDLDLTGPRSLHQLLDVSLSRQGSQRLAEWLQQDDPDLETILARQPIVRELAASRRFRLRLLLNYRRAQEDPLDGAQLVEWLQAPYPQERLRWLLPVGVLLALLNLSLFLLASFAGLPNYWILTLVAYISFYLLNSSYLSEFLEAVVHMDSELGKARSLLTYLERYPLRDRRQLVRLLAPIREADPQPTRLVRRVKWITAAVGLRANPVLGLLINALVPWDMFFAVLAGRARGTLAERLPAWLETLYKLEALCGLANLADFNPDYRFPQIGGEKRPVLEAEGLGHPLLPPEQKVRNDFSLQDPGRVVIITGSNMAGKSTFLKTIGVNMCLAYAGGPVDARRLQMVPFRLHTCMRISDSLTEGYSYFYAEVRCLKRLLERVREDGLPLLYLVDEIFRGTNNRERLIGSRAYIQALTGTAGVGFLATHDLELASLADESSQVLNYHFRESVADRRLVFDYRLRPGPCPTTNALKIMELEGLPVESQPGEGWDSTG